MTLDVAEAIFHAGRSYTDIPIIRISSSTSTLSMHSDCKFSKHQLVHLITKAILCHWRVTSQLEAVQRRLKKLQKAGRDKVAEEHRVDLIRAWRERDFAEAWHCISSS